MRIQWLTVFLDFPVHDLENGVAFWSDVTGASLSPWRGTADEFATLAPPRGDACVRVQRVRDGASRCHLDLHVGPRAESLTIAIDRARTLGARILRRLGDLVIAESPGGFVFCLVPHEEERTPPLAADFGAGGTARADQLCLDIPPQMFEPECVFWAALTGWELHCGSRPEFAYLERPAHIPVRLLLQRRDTAAPGETVTAHIDFACTDPWSLARQHTAHGATAQGRFPHWITMADPTGRPYCLTMRDPVTGKLNDNANR